MRQELVLRALHHARRQAEDHAELLTRAAKVLDNALYPRDTWGQGKYSMDLNYYHGIKSQLLAEFKSHFGDTFTKKCGTNPDLEGNRKGFVSPSATDKKLKNAGTCKKSEFELDLSAKLTELMPKA